MSALVCGSAIAASVDPKVLVLRVADLPVGFSVTTEGYVTNGDAASGNAVVPIPVSRSVQWGRLTGYERTFEKDDASAGFSVAFLSNVSVFRASSGAKSAASYLFARFASRRQWDGLLPKALPMPVGLGDRARMYRLDAQGNSTIFVVWCTGRTQALLGLAGTDRVTPEKALLYARKMQTRIQRLAGG